MSIWPLLALVVPLTMGGLSLWRRPTWLAEGPLVPHWVRINVWSMAFSLACGLGVWWGSQSQAPVFQWACVLGAGTLAMALGQTLFTDLAQRKADRRILRLATATTLLSGLWFLWSQTNSTVLVVYLVWFALATVVVFLPGIGASDGRALQLVVAAGFPVLGFSGFQWGLLFLVVALVIWMVVVVVRKRSLGALVLRVSQPLVPFILAPFLLAVLLFSMMPPH